ncbi:polycystic kidney disease 2 [Thecamonas trahens ATCC 50062]|uniref:Polycystic kidney disease 2 n=1 Tax=Thecamonas trahens ATCC 50062 TaxID=461836 RepID=A0A0L0DFF9_THETB|nr:polycystic kidney disease 2 [Thecamonas trahens ATCC 50062]KNC50965.1 polycystic kidney disease 2 [Thecamonas trahens ATCC 50062]|eukprot:XP_013756661.1 polycystic kidney disease 2 [Thecamonas trahens ATCC 50062]
MYSSRRSESNVSGVGDLLASSASSTSARADRADRADRGDRGDQAGSGQQAKYMSSPSGSSDCGQDGVLLEEVKRSRSRAGRSYNDGPRSRRSRSRQPSNAQPPSSGPPRGRRRRSRSLKPQALTSVGAGPSSKRAKTSRDSSGRSSPTPPDDNGIGAASTRGRIVEDTDADAGAGRSSLGVLGEGGRGSADSAAADERAATATLAPADGDGDGDGDDETRFPFPKCSDPGLLVEVLIYMAFLIVFSLVVFNMRDPLYSFLHNDNMKDLFLDEEFPGIDVLKTFRDVATKEEFWQFLHGPFINGLLGDFGAGEGVIYGVNWLVGSARMRQVRVKPALCDVHADFFPLITQCYGRYAIGEEDREPYGPGDAWTYRSCGELGSVCKQYARLRRYDGGGYTQDFGAGTLATESARLAALEADNWVDLQTRAVFIDFTTYNPTVNLFLVAQLQFEFMPSGGVYPDFKFRVLRLYRYEGTNGTLQLVGELAIAIFVCLFFLEELVQMCVSCLRSRRVRALRAQGILVESRQTPYFRDAWNYVDHLNIVFFLVVFYCRYKVDANFDALNLVPSDRSTYFDFTRPVMWDAAEKSLLACNAFLLWFKVFKFAVFAPRMGMIAKVVGKAFLPLFFFIFMFMFVLFGFAQAGALAFGSDVEGYDTLGTTIFTMLLATLGEFDFEGLRHSNRGFGPFFFFTFIILIFFIVLSMFLAIVDNAYDEVSEELRRSQEPSVFAKALAWFSTTKVGSRMASFLELQDKLTEIRRAIEIGDLNHDGKISKKELQIIMDSKREYFEGTAADLMERYDVDNDNMLSEAERARFYADMEREQTAIASKIVSLREANSEEFTLLFDLLSDRISTVESRLAVQLALLEARVKEEAQRLGRARLGSSRP